MHYGHNTKRHTMQVCNLNLAGFRIANTHARSLHCKLFIGAVNVTRAA